MSNPKPCLGYPSRSEAAYALRTERGLKDREIAELIGVAPNSVGNLIRHARSCRQRLPSALGPEIRMAAIRRGKTERQLINLLLERVVARGLLEELLGEAGNG